MTDVPYYQRTLDSFSDEIITRVRPSSSGTLWYVVLDRGVVDQVGDPDFSWAAETREDAVAQCAERIRKDAQGIGKYPHSIMVPGHDLHHRLMKHWADKETIRDLGGDPNAAVLAARASVETNPWKLWGGHRLWREEAPQLEMLYQVALHQLGAALANGDNPTEAMEAMHGRVIDGYLNTIARHARPGAHTWELMRSRTADYVRDLGYYPEATAMGMRR